MFEVLLYLTSNRKDLPKNAFYDKEFNLDSYTHNDCFGDNSGSINLTLSNPNSTIQWSGPNSFISNNIDINNLIAGTYYLTITNLIQGCTSSDSIIIQETNKISAEVNSSVENIGARRLHTIIEKVLDDISFNATDKAGETITVDKKFVQDNLGNLVKDTDLSKFIL